MDHHTTQCQATWHQLFQDRLNSCTRHLQCSLCETPFTELGISLDLPQHIQHARLLSHIIVHHTSPVPGFCVDSPTEHFVCHIDGWARCSIVCARSPEPDPSGSACYPDYHVHCCSACQTVYHASHALCESGIEEDDLTMWRWWQSPGLQDVTDESAVNVTPWGTALLAAPETQTAS